MGGGIDLLELADARFEFVSGQGAPIAVDNVSATLRYPSLFELFFLTAQLSLSDAPLTLSVEAQDLFNMIQGGQSQIDFVAQSAGGAFRFGGVSSLSGETLGNWIRKPTTLRGSLRHWEPDRWACPRRRPKVQQCQRMLRCRRNRSWI